MVRTVFRIMGHYIICMGKTGNIHPSSDILAMIYEGNPPLFLRVNFIPVLYAMDFVVITGKLFSKSIKFRVVFVCHQSPLCGVASPVKIDGRINPTPQFKDWPRSHRN
jgi:hypothetical protein